MREDSDMVKKIRAMAMRDEGVSDAEMAAIQAEKLALMAEREGGPAAIRAAMRPRAAPKATARAPVARSLPPEADSEYVRSMIARDRAPVTRPLPAGTPDPQWLIEQMQQREQPPAQFGPPSMAIPGAIGGAMQQAAPMPRRPLMAEPQAAPPAAQAQEALAQMPPEQQQGLLQMLMQMLRPQQGPQPGQWGQPVPQLRNPAATPMP